MSWFSECRLPISHISLVVLQKNKPAQCFSKLNECGCMLAVKTIAEHYGGSMCLINPLLLLFQYVKGQWCKGTTNINWYNIWYIYNTMSSYLSGTLWTYVGYASRRHWKFKVKIKSGNCVLMWRMLDAASMQKSFVCYFSNLLLKS